MNQTPAQQQNKNHQSNLARKWASLTPSEKATWDAANPTALPTYQWVAKHWSYIANGGEDPVTQPKGDPIALPPVIDACTCHLNPFELYAEVRSPLNATEEDFYRVRLQNARPYSPSENTEPVRMAGFLKYVDGQIDLTDLYLAQFGEPPNHDSWIGLYLNVVDQSEAFLTNFTREVCHCQANPADGSCCTNSSGLRSRYTIRPMQLQNGTCTLAANYNTPEARRLTTETSYLARGPNFDGCKGTARWAMSCSPEGSAFFLHTNQQVVTYAADAPLPCNSRIPFLLVYASDEITGWPELLFVDPD